MGQNQVLKYEPSKYEWIDAPQLVDGPMPDKSLVERERVVVSRLHSMTEDWADVLNAEVDSWIEICNNQNRIIHRLGEWRDTQIEDFNDSYRRLTIKYMKQVMDVKEELRAANETIALLSRVQPKDDSR